MADLNQWWRMPGDISAALDLAAVGRIADELRELDVLWLEEPLPGRRPGRDAVAAGADRHQGRRRRDGAHPRRAARRRWTRARSTSCSRTPCSRSACSRARTVAEVALLADRWFTPHTWTNGLGLLANLHLAAGVGGGPYLEFPFDPPGWTVQRRDFFLAEPLLIGPDGCLPVPTGRDRASERH